MSVDERINALWNVVRPDSIDARRKRQRLAAAVALTMLLSGLLTAVGLAVVVLVFAVLVAILVGVTALTRALPHYWPPLRSEARTIGAGIMRHLRGTAAQAQSVLKLVRGVAVSALASLRDRGPRLARRCADEVARARRRVATWTRATVRRLGEAVESMRSAPQRQPKEPIDLYREAVRLNTAGTGERRSGHHTEAVGLHRRALEILLKLDDRRAVALTQNNLALALSHLGEDSNAVALFEEAAATLRELGEEEHEGRIIANLGLAHRRHGRHEESGNVLQLALTKLPPASTAYETVLAELRRAS